MNEISLRFNLESPQEAKRKIVIRIGEKPEENLLYKFIVGSDGNWSTLKDFTKEETVVWVPEEDGKYILMMQAKREDSSKPFDYITRQDYIIGKVEEKLISNVYLDKDILNIGDKLTITVESRKMPVMFRYWIKEKDSWELAKDYSADNILVRSVKSAGEQEVLVECKGLDSKNKFDDFMKCSFKVQEIKKLEIRDFKCLSSELLADNELLFQVDAESEDSRVILYKFVRINSDGKVACIQDYSSKRIVNFTEKESGKFKLLCMVKDMYSQNEYDDRAVINYVVKPYREVTIQNFTTDLSSPQISGSIITLKTIVKGGRELQYRFIIDGNYGEDSGYVKSNTYIWKTKKSGEYTIDLWVKDISFIGNYEARSTINFTIDEQSKEPVKINEIILDRDTKLVKNDTVTVKAIASGGIELRYSFIVLKEKKELERVDYGTCNWVNFTPEEGGNYILEVRAKDKYSNREYDSHSFIELEVFDYIPAAIDYVLFPSKEQYMVGDTILFHVISKNTQKTLIRYVLSINGHMVEDSNYIKDKKYAITPKCSGTYLIQMYVKNEDGNNEYDCKKEVKFMVHDTMPILNTKIHCNKTLCTVNKSITFSVTKDGGRDVLYEFYLMEKGDWNIVQSYSRKDSYTFIPFAEGDYKILALCKSAYKSCTYEDYAIFEFYVGEEKVSL